MPDPDSEHLFRSESDLAKKFRIWQDPDPARSRVHNTENVWKTKAEIKKKDVKLS